jgi:hypothetical protein
LELELKGRELGLLLLLLLLLLLELLVLLESELMEELLLLELLLLLLELLLEGYCRGSVEGGTGGGVFVEVGLAHEEVLDVTGWLRGNCSEERVPLLKEHLKGICGCLFVCLCRGLWEARMARVISRRI